MELVFDRLRLEVSRARTRDAAREAVFAARRDASPGPHAARAALARVASDPGVIDATVWPVVEVVRDALAALDDELDRALRDGLLAVLPDDAPARGDRLASELAACGADEDRARRSLAVAWELLGPPSSRAAAAVVDVLRAHPLGAARGALYRALVARGVDVRAALADDRWLPPRERLSALAAWAARAADAGRLRAIAWGSDPDAALLRALADWPAHATHPRQVFHGYRVRRALTDDDAYRAALGALRARPLPPEVRAQLEHELAREPVAIPAREFAPGRFECGRCGDRRVAARARRAVDAADPAAGAELEYDCGACGARYFALWERDAPSPARVAAPEAWSVA